MNVLAVDVGSSSVRAEVYDHDGEPVEGTETKLDHDFDYTADGGATKDAEQLLDLVSQAIDGALARAGEARISAVAADTFWHSVLGIDGEGNPTTPILTWADRRAADAPPSFGTPWTSAITTAGPGACSTPATGPQNSCG